MLNLKVMNKGLRGVLTASEFEMLYVISNGLGKANEFKHFPDRRLAELTGVTERQVRRLTKSLEDKGFINTCTKQVSKTIRNKYYRLDLSILDKPTEFESTSDTVECEDIFNDFPF